MLHEAFPYQPRRKKSGSGLYKLEAKERAGIVLTGSKMEISKQFEDSPQISEIEIELFIPLKPDQKHGMWVKDFKPYEYILWTDKAGKATCLWYIYVNERRYAPDYQAKDKI